MKKITLQEINERCRLDPVEFIGACEQIYTQTIESIAKQVCDARKERPILLLNGPSSSGKTTTARRIRDAVRRRGVPSHTISMDDYYITRTDAVMPVDENGDIDLESPECMDLPLLTAHLQALVEGKTIAVPKYDFASHSRMEEAEECTLGTGEIVVIEGIHALNSALMGPLSEHAIGVYMAVGTEVRVEKGFRLSPHKLRFVRRAIRDRNFRGASVEETISMWRSVRRGEKLYIKPNVQFATHIINTYLPYEDCVLMNQLRPLMAGHQEAMTEAKLEEVVRALELFEPIPESAMAAIPEQSIMHEFIG